MHKKIRITSRFGFTLIELMVVMFIIGLLSVIMFVNYFDTSDRARIAKDLNFEAQVDHALGGKLVGEWTFDNIASNQTTVNDSSANNNDLSVCSDPGFNCATTNDCYPPIAQCLQNVGMSQCFSTTIHTDPNNPNPVYWLGRKHTAFFSSETSKSHTISLWVELQPPYNSDTPHQMLVSQYDEYQLEIYMESVNGKNTNEIKMTHHIDVAPGFKDREFFVNTGGIPNDNSWHHIVAVWDNVNGKYAAFLDGVKELQLADPIKPETDTPSASYGNFTIGRNSTAGTNGACDSNGGIYSFGDTNIMYFWTGLIDRVRIYNDALPI